MKKKASVIQNQDRFIRYQYDGKPLIILDLLDRTIKTTKGTLDFYGERACQQQASILLRLLRSHKYAHFKQVSITVNPNRIGKTAKDREITFKAIKYLFNDPTQNE